MGRLRPKAVSRSTVAVLLLIKSQDSAVSAGTRNILNQGKSGQRYHRLAGRFPTAVPAASGFVFSAFLLGGRPLSAQTWGSLIWLCIWLLACIFSISLVPSGAFLHDCGSLTTLPWVSFGARSCARGSFAKAAANTVRAGLVGSARGPALPSQLLAVNTSEILNPLVSQRLHLCCLHQPLWTVGQSSLHFQSLSPARVPPARQAGVRWFRVQPGSLMPPQGGQASSEIPLAVFFLPR